MFRQTNRNRDCSSCASWRAQVGTRSTPLSWGQGRQRREAKPSQQPPDILPPTGLLFSKVWEGDVIGDVLQGAVCGAMPRATSNRLLISLGLRSVLATSSTLRIYAREEVPMVSSGGIFRTECEPVGCL